MNPEDITPTTWPQRWYLIGNVIAMLAMTWVMWKEDIWLRWLFSGLDFFMLLILVANWETTYTGPREWHDYR